MQVRLLLVVSVLSILILPHVSITSADGVPYNWYNPFRLPWTEGASRSRDIGCGVFEPYYLPSPPAPPYTYNIYYGGHGAGTANQWNIDFGTMYWGDFIRAIGGGTITYGFEQYGLGQFAVISHSGGWTSTYAHMCGSYPFPASSVVHQGDWIGSAGNTGNTSGGGSPCTSNSGAHLHLEVKLNGQSQNALMSGFYIDHLSSNQYGYHESNNTGPGYPYPNFYNLWFRNKYTDLNGVIGSTLRPTAGYCGYQSRWVHDCNVYYWGNITSQNFMGLGNTPSALAQGFPNVNLIFGAMWYVYTVGWSQGNWIAEWMGRLSTDEFVNCFGSYDYSCQYFEGGYSVKIWTYFPTLYEDVWACRQQWVPQCQWIGSFAYADHE